MIKELIYFIILFVLFFVLSNPFIYDTVSKTYGKLPKEALVLLLGLIYAGLAWLIYYLMKMGVYSKDGFHFEVSPENRSCLFGSNYKYCPPGDLSADCCPRGFHGRPVGFRYSADWERGSGCACGCPHVTRNNPDDYYEGGNEWSCQQCRGGSVPQPDLPIMGIPPSG